MLFIVSAPAVTHSGQLAFLRCVAITRLCTMSVHTPHPSNPFPEPCLCSPPFLPAGHLVLAMKKQRWTPVLADIQPASLRQSHKMPFRVSQSTNGWILFLREKGSNRKLWMFPLSHAECGAIWDEDTRTKKGEIGHSDAFVNC